MGLRVVIFQEMMIEGGEYLSQHGFIMSRAFHSMMVYQLQKPFALSGAVMLMPAGLAVPGFTFSDLPEVMAKLPADAWVVYDLFAGS